MPSASLYVNKSISPKNKYNVYTGTAESDSPSDFQYGTYPAYNYNKAIRSKMLTKTKRNQMFIKKP